MKKIKYIILLLFVCLLASCSNNQAQTIKYDMLNNYKYFVISSYETYLEYQTTLVDKKIDYESLGFIDKYNQDFFNDNGLVILNVEEISSDYTLKYKSYELVENSFTVNISRKNSKGVANEAMQTWTFFITINNQEARYINSIFTNINGQIKQIKNFEIFE
ncbi:MAG: hypothetical protein IJZ77_03300 [Bacilli bacterium]|nr:hypothetical protein [Bacilli bacterium]